MTWFLWFFSRTVYEGGNRTRKEGPDWLVIGKKVSIRSQRVESAIVVVKVQLYWDGSHSCTCMHVSVSTTGKHCYWCIWTSQVGLVVFLHNMGRVQMWIHVLWALRWNSCMFLNSAFLSSWVTILGHSLMVFRSLVFNLMVAKNCKSSIFNNIPFWANTCCFQSHAKPLSWSAVQKLHE